MTLINELSAFRKLGPGYFIREQLEIRNWTQEDLAAVMGFTLKHINKILTDQQPITLENARILSEIFNNTPQYWVNLNTDYRLWLETEKSDQEKEAEIKSRIYERMPITDMIKKGWLKPYQNTGELQNQVVNFWGMKTLDFTSIDSQLKDFLSQKTFDINGYQAWYTLTWYRKAQIESGKISIGNYKIKELEKLYQDLHRYTIMENGINIFLTKLQECGVIFFVLPHLQKTYLDGAAFLSQKNPVIVYTGRFKRRDDFWFTIAHEIAHVLLHIPNKNTFFLDDFKNGELFQIEQEANSLAFEKLKHAEVLDYLNPYFKYLQAEKVEECAEIYNIHPSIIIGKLTEEKKISSSLNFRKENVLEMISKRYLIK